MNRKAVLRDESTGHTRKSMREVVHLVMGYRGYWSRWLEPCDGKLSRTVLRGRGHRKVPKLPGGICLVAGLLLVNALLSYQSKHIDPPFWSVLKYQLIVLPLFLASNMLIRYGIKFGFKATGNLTFVLTAFKGLEIIGIPVLMGFLFLKEVPS